jgi:YVTN family beta-propeller protein
VAANGRWDRRPAGPQRATGRFLLPALLIVAVAFGLGGPHNDTAFLPFPGPLRRWLVTSTRSAGMAALVLFATATPVLAGSSNSLLDLSPDGSRLLTANSDNGTVSVIDTATRKVLHEIPVGDKPEGVTWLGAGPVAAVTVYSENKVVLFDAAAGKVVATLRVANEPYGAVATRDGRRLYVTHEYPGTVSEIDVAARKVLREIPAGHMVRGIALSPDETRLYVTEFYTARLNAIDLATGKIVDTWHGHSTDNLARNVVLHPSRPKAYVAHIRSIIERVAGNGSIFPHLTVYTLTPPADGERRVSFALDTYNGVYNVTNPWESAVSPDGRRLYTIYAGTNDMNVSRINDDDYNEIERLGRAVRVGQNPQAVRVSPDGASVYVYNALDFEVGVYEADTLAPRGKIKACAPPKTPEWVRGKILFSTALPPMTAQRWVACASCHPDGHSDGRVWHNPEGLRKTTALFGMAHTHPLHWSADRDEAQDFEYTIRGPLMQGVGLLGGSMKPKTGFDKTELVEPLAGRSKDLDALAVYCNSFDFTLSPNIPAPGQLSPAAARGKALFFGEAVGCATCHSGPYYTDSSLKKPFNLHDIGTGNDDPSEKMGPRYDTPTLLGVYRTGPYLHHGRAKTLRDVLTTCNKENKHGKTSHLMPCELDDLVEFLKSLPYEPPPDVTPNTVQYRVAPKKT